MKYDQTELIEFFGVLPSGQEPEEKEFFATTVFDYQQNRYHLSVSFSIYRNDFYMDLRDTDVAETILELRLERVDEIKVRRDKPASVPMLIVRARCNEGSDEKEAIMQAIQIRLEPNISIRLNNELE